ncbi:trehalose synthase [Serinibacter arcticus]|uniref:Trehalose synthase n=1 Tax=Serinibacter arcticus TaxID=1655435 RepID=A0A2U1ZVG1_9MICO|nr:alpha-amylase family protein [Serinibacter arcticus]PWD50933.1 trehalose synthase [Serinibacter arcticus]
MRRSDASDLWWKNAVIYCLDVKQYLDDDADGSGDLQGLVRRVDYLAELGVSCLWLMPIYTTPGRDGGYDVADFYGIDPALGTHGDLVEVIRTARDRGIRVILDLLVNHTSDRHPWFVNARRSRNSRYRDFYIWSDEVPPDAPETMFPGEEDGVWEWDEKTEQYYSHSFYHHQPDLNVENPKVRDELAKVIGFWLEVGVSGFRVDAVPSFVSRTDGDSGTSERDHRVLQSLRQFAQRRSAEAMLLGEVNLPYDEQKAYFGSDGDGELHMQFDFVANQALYLSLARHDPGPLITALQSRPELAAEAQWGIFVRNHDELTLDQLSDAERREVFDAFGPQEDHQVYGRGLRRRLPPMMDGDPRRVRMIYSLMFSLPGTPVLFYGEEIGMGENLDIDGRMAVRTPMQWNHDGGFSLAPPSRHATAMTSGAYGPRHVNVEEQISDPDSLLHFVRSLAQTYRRSPEIGWGELAVLDPGCDGVLVHSCDSDVGRFVGVHSFADEPRTVRFDLGEEPDGVSLVCLADGSTFEPLDGVVELDLAAYGARRLRVCRPGDQRLR